MSDVVYAQMAFPSSPEPISPTASSTAGLLLHAQPASTSQSASSSTTSATHNNRPITDSTPAAEYTNVANIATVYPDSSAYVNMTQIRRSPSTPGVDAVTRPQRTTHSAIQFQRHPDAVNGFSWDSPAADQAVPHTGDFNTQHSVSAASRVEIVELTLWQTIKYNKFSYLAAILLPLLLAATAMFVMRSVRGNSITKTTTQAPTLPPLPVSENDFTLNAAFFASTSQQSSTSNIFAKFDSLTAINNGEIFDKESFTMTSQLGGYYWFHFDAMISSEASSSTIVSRIRSIAMEDVHSGKLVTIRRLHLTTSNMQQDRLSGDYLVYMEPNDAFQLVLNENEVATSEHGLTWLGFSLDPDNLVAFSVEATTDDLKKSSNDQSLIMFSRVHLNKGGGWLKNQNMFSASRPHQASESVYFFTFSAIASSSTSKHYRADFVLSHGDLTTQFSASVVSHTMLVSLSHGDLVHVQNSGTPLMSASLKGFLCPQTKVPGAAWSVAVGSTLRWLLYGQQIPFDKLIYNSDFVWDIESNAARIKVHGIYCLSYVAKTRLSRVGPVAINLVIDFNNKISSISIRPTYYEIQDVRERTVLANVTSQAHMTFVKASESDSLERGTSFSGFLVFPS